MGSLQFQRLLTECALRLAWTAGEFTTGDSHGWPEAAAGWSERIDRLRKRDQLNLAAASDAIHAVGGGSTPAADELRVKAESIDVAAAPPNLRAMATNPVAKSAYAAHRLCSSLVHPGAGIGRIHKVSDAEINGRMDMAAYLCIACGNALLRGLKVRVDLTGPSQ